MSASSREKVASLLREKRAAIRARYSVLKALPPPRPKLPLVLPAMLPSTAIVIGRDQFGAPFELPEDVRLRHEHVIGVTGGGKSNLYKKKIREDIRRGRGVCLLDPDGNDPESVYRSTLIWMHDNPRCWRGKKLHLIDPNLPTYTVGFNPLALPTPEFDPTVIAEATFEAFERIWGDEDGNTKPTIQRVLIATFTALAERGLTLAEASHLFSVEDKLGLRAYLLDTLKDEEAREEIAWLDEMARDRWGKRDFRAEVTGPRNRLAKLLRSRALRTIVGQTDRVLDLREALDEGHIILANLSGGPRAYDGGGDLLGRLLIRFLFFHATHTRTSREPYFVYIDECHRFLSGEIEKILAQVRKRGIAVSLAHQWQGQIAKADTATLEAVRNSTEVKIVFRLKDPKEAEDLAPMVLSLNLEMPVRVLDKPIVVGHRRMLLESRSRGESSGTTLSQSHTQSQEFSHMRGGSKAEETGWSEAHNTARTTARGTADTVAHTTARGTADTVAHTESESVTETEGVSEAVAVGSSAATTYSSGESVGYSTAATWPGDHIAQLYPDTITTSNSYGSASGIASTTGTSRVAARGTSKATSRGRATAETRAHTDSFAEADTVAHTTDYSEADTVGQTIGRSGSQSHTESSAHTVGNSVGRATGTATSSETSRTCGVAESLEPILEVRPSAVHDLEKLRHMAGEAIRSLPVGVAFISYVGRDGRVATRLHVPEITSGPMSEAQFGAVAQKLIAASPSALLTTDAENQIETRQRQLMGLAAAAIEERHEEPKSFRVPVPTKTASKPVRRSHGEP